MVLPFFFPATLIVRLAGPEETKNLAGKCPPPDSDPFRKRFLLKPRQSCQAKMPDVGATIEERATLSRDGSPKRRNRAVSFCGLIDLPEHARHPKMLCRLL